VVDLQHYQWLGTSSSRHCLNGVREILKKRSDNSLQKAGLF
jgi:hypothetical protein